MLQDPDELAHLRRELRPASLGTHWPLYASDPRRLDLLTADEAGFQAALERIAASLTGVPLDYVLVHFPERGEPWPSVTTVHRRLAHLATLAARLDLRVVLEPKEALGGSPDGLCAFARTVDALPDGVELCVDVSDWQTAGDNMGQRPPLAMGAAQIHLHARHVQPGGPFYRHAAPWVDLPPEAGWTVRNVRPAELDGMVAGVRRVRVCIEVVHHYLPLLAPSIGAVRRDLSALGWREDTSVTG